MRTEAWRVIRILSATLLLASPVFAQIPIGTSGSLGASFMNLNTVDALGEQQLTGFGIGGNMTVAYQRLGLGLRYLEGSVSSGDNGTDRDLVEGEAIFSVRASPWLRIGLGPHIRSLIIPEGTERWVFLEARVQTTAQLGSPRLASVLELWQVLSANVDVDDPYDGGRGLSGTLRWEVATMPLWIGLGYRIDRSNLDSGSRTEVMEHFVISVGIGRGAN